MKRFPLLPDNDRLNRFISRYHAISCWFHFGNIFFMTGLVGVQLYFLVMGNPHSSILTLVVCAISALMSVFYFAIDFPRRKTPYCRYWFEVSPFVMRDIADIEANGCLVYFRAKTIPRGEYTSIFQALEGARIYGYKNVLHVGTVLIDDHIMLKMKYQR